MIGKHKGKHKKCPTATKNKAHPQHLSGNRRLEGVAECSEGAGKKLLSEAYTKNKEITKTTAAGLREEQPSAYTWVEASTGEGLLSLRATSLFSL